jgi:hypothetical protein
MRGGFMRSQFRKYFLGVSLALVMSMAVPVMAETISGDGSDGILTRIINGVMQVLDVVEIKISLPPG